jgi:hypothetical protein
MLGGGCGAALGEREDCTGLGAVVGVATPARECRRMAWTARREVLQRKGGGAGRRGEGRERRGEVESGEEAEGGGGGSWGAGNRKQEKADLQELQERTLNILKLLQPNKPILQNHSYATTSGASRTALRSFSSILLMISSPFPTTLIVSVSGPLFPLSAAYRTLPTPSFGSKRSARMCCSPSTSLGGGEKKGKDRLKKEMCRGGVRGGTTESVSRETSHSGF